MFDKRDDIIFKSYKKKDKRNFNLLKREREEESLNDLDFISKKIKNKKH